MYELSQDNDVFLSECLRWKKLYSKLQMIKLEETNLRIAICNKIFKDEYKNKTLNINNFKIKATAKINTKIDNAVLDTVWQKLTDNEKLCIKFTPELIKKNYDALSNSKILDECITRKPGTPTLDIKG